MTPIDPMQRNWATADSTFDTEKGTFINVDKKFQLIYCRNNEFALFRFDCMGSIQVVKYEISKIKF